MATATLVLNEPQLVTLEAAAGNLREVVVPARTRYLEYSSTAAWFYEIDAGQADGGAGTAADQQRFDPGTASIRCPGSGSGQDHVRQATSLFLTGSGAAQQIWLTATSRAP